MIKPIIIFLTSISTTILVLGIIFEGKLKKSNRSKTTNTNLKSEIQKLSGWGKFLIMATIVLNLGNGFLAINNIDNSDQQHTQDTTRISNLQKTSNESNKQFRIKRILDSTQILYLQKITLDNGLKSDSIKFAVINNASKALEEQRKSIEREKENVFSHLQNEVEDNLQKMLVYYTDKEVLFLIDTSIYLTVKLNNTYINKYGAISSQRNIVSHFSQASETIEAVNKYLDQVSIAPAKSYEKKYNSTQFLGKVEEAKNYLYPIYYKVRKLKSYKEFESMNFNSILPKNYRDELNNFLELDYITGPKLK